MNETLDDKAYTCYCNYILNTFGFSTTVNKNIFINSYRDRGYYFQFYNFIIINERKNKIEKIKNVINGSK